MVTDLGLPQIIEETFFQGYTVFNTLVYGIILILVLVGIIKLFEKLDIMPTSIIYSLIPFIFFGSCTRALVDNGILPYNVFLITPGIYFLVGFLAIFTLIGSWTLYKKYNIDYRYIIFLIGIIFAIIPFSKIPHLNGNILAQIIIPWIILTSIFYIIGKFWKLYENKINLSIISAHIFDATTTFIAVDFYNYQEQHVLPGAIYNLTNTAITMYPLKIVVITLGLYLVDQYIDDKQLNSLIKLVIFVLGLAPGLRNFLTMAIGIN